MQRLCLATLATFLLVVAPARAATSITSGPPAVTNHTSATFTFTGASPGGGGYECWNDVHTTPTACTSPLTVTGFPAGAHTETVEAGTDVPATWHWTVDLTAPTVVITSEPPAVSTSSSATFAFDSPDSDVASYACSIDGGTYSSCSSPKAFASLADGAHEFSVEAIDHAGNATTPSPSYSWSIDATPPDTLIAGPPLISHTQTVTFTISSSDPTVTSFLCEVDGNPYGPCPAQVPVGNLADGFHVFAAKSVDPAGNVDPVPAVYHWTQNTQGPAAPTLHVRLHGDRTGPSVTWVDDPKVTATWAAGTGGAAKVQLQVAEYDGSGILLAPEAARGRTPFQGVDGNYTVFATTPAQTLDVSIRPGDTYCFVAVALDVYGNATNGKPRCVTRPLGIKKFLRSGADYSAANSPFTHPYYFHDLKTGAIDDTPPPVPAPTGLTATSQSESGLFWTAQGAHPVLLAKSLDEPPNGGPYACDDECRIAGVAIVATECPTCGSIKVSVGEAYWERQIETDTGEPHAFVYGPLFDPPLQRVQKLVSLESRRVRKHALIVVGGLGSFTGSKLEFTCTRKDCIPNLALNTDFIRNRYVEIQRVSGKPRIESAVVRPEIHPIF